MRALRSRGRGALVVLLPAALLLAPRRAGATDTNTILGSRSNSHESPQHWAVELRFGTYNPEIDSEPGLAGIGATPYHDFFGTDDNRRPKTHFTFGAEVDFQALRIPFVGTIGPGVAAHYAQMDAHTIDPKHPTPADQPKPTNTSMTTLQVVPMFADAVLRIDVFMRSLHVPLVPYAKAGVGFGYWRTSTDLGTSTTVDPVTQKTLSRGEGGTFGFHLAGGLAFQLDVLDLHTARNFDADYGVNHSYIFFEGDRMGLTGWGASKPALILSSTTWATGLAFEF